MYKNIYKYDDMKRREHMAVREHVGWVSVDTSVGRSAGRGCTGFSGSSLHKDDINIENRKGAIYNNSG